MVLSWLPHLLLTLTNVSFKSNVPGAPCSDYWEQLCSLRVRAPKLANHSLFGKKWLRVTQWLR
jgi:hypothetical protein